MKEVPVCTRVVRVFFFLLSCTQAHACHLVSAVPDYTPGRGNNCLHVLSFLSSSYVRSSFFFVVQSITLVESAADVDANCTVSEQMTQCASYSMCGFLQYGGPL